MVQIQRVLAHCQNIGLSDDVTKDYKDYNYLGTARAPSLLELEISTKNPPLAHLLVLL